MKQTKWIKSITALGLIAMITLSGCTNNEDTPKQEQEPEERLTTALAKLDAYDSYAERVECHDTIISDVDEKDALQEQLQGVLFWDLSYENTFINTSDKKYRIFTEPNDGKEWFQVSVYSSQTKENEQVMGTLNNNQFELVSYEKLADGDNVIAFDNTLKLVNDNMKLFNDNTQGDDKNYFTLSQVKDGDHTLIIYTVNDLQGYDEKRVQIIKENNPDYDPLNINGTKLTKRETLEQTITYTLDANDELIKLEETIKTDYGNNIIVGTVNTYTIEKQTDIDANKIDKILNDIADGTLQEGDIIAW